MDRGAWQPQSMGPQRVRHDWVTNTQWNKNKQKSSLRSWSGDIPPINSLESSSSRNVIPLLHEHVFISVFTGSMHSHSYLLALTVRWKRPNKAQLPFPLQNQTRGLICGGRLYVHILRSVTVSLLGKRVCVLKLRIVRRDHPGLSGWALNPIRNVLIRDRRGDNTDAGGKAMYRRRQTLDSGSCNRGTPGALRSSQRGEQGHSLEVSEGARTHQLFDFGLLPSQVVLMVKDSPASRRHKRCGFDPWDGKSPLEEGMATHSSILAWRIPWTEEPGGLQPMWSQTFGHDWSDIAYTHALQKGKRINFYYLINSVVYKFWVICYSPHRKLRYTW